MRLEPEFRHLRCPTRLSLGRVATFEFATQLKVQPGATEAII